MKKLGLGSFGRIFLGKIVKKKKSLFLRDNKEPTFYGIGIFEWAAVLSVLALILSVILKNL